MKINFFRTFFVILALFLTAISAEAQKRGSPSVAPARPSSGSPVSFRLLANYDFIMTSPGDLNGQRASFLWNSTTATQGTFNNMNGFTVGGAYFLGQGFLGVEYSHALQELQNTLIAPGTYSVKDTFNYDTVYVLYDWVFNKGSNQSYELGLGVGQAIKFQYHNVLTTAVTEDLFWQATPMVFKARANYSYHFSNHVRLRVGATYENATSSSMKADSNHPTITVNGSGIVSGQTLKSASTGADTKVDVSGFRFNAGLVVAF